MNARRPSVLALLALALHTLFAVSIFEGLGAPLLWHDEADTAMFGRRILDYGFPKVHGPVNVTYGVQHSLEVGSRVSLDAYVGSPWGQYYFAAPAVAWSDGAEDLAERTWRVRLPFVLAGWLGVLLLGGVGARVAGRLGADPGGFWCVYGGLLLASVSLQLHLREARYYPLVVLALGVIAMLEWRRQDRGEGLLRSGPLGLALAVWCLFHLFYPAFGAVTVGAGGVHAALAFRRGSTLAERAALFLRGAGPYLVAGLAALPMALFYQIPAQGQAFLEAFDGEAHRYGARFVDGAIYLLRYEWLATALVGSGALAVLSRTGRTGGGLGPSNASLGPGVWTAGAVLAVTFAWWSLVARTPFFYERYYVSVSPLLMVATAVASAALWQRGRASASGARMAQGALATLAIVAATSLVVREPELAGRWRSFGQTYQGPLDDAIRFVGALPSQRRPLVVATNYEDHAFMFYLGARAVLGFYAPDRAADAAVDPDVIVIRPWGQNTKALAQQALRGEFETHERPVANLKANNVPSLSTRNQAGLVHRFESPPPNVGHGSLWILVRKGL